jgi:hypothetical protein
MSGLALPGGGHYSAEHGQALDGGAQRLAEILHDYNSNFEMQFIPERARTHEDPYRIVDNTPGLPQSIVRYITVEDMKQPHKVLAEIFQGDLRYHTVYSILEAQELEETAAKLFDLKRQSDKADEDADLLAFQISGGSDRKHYIRHGGQTLER